MGIEYTKAFSSTNGGSAGFIGAQYVQLGNGSPASGTAFVIQSMKFTSSLAATVTPNYSLSVSACDDNAGDNAKNLYISNSDWATFSTVTTGYPLIVTQPYLAYDAYQDAGSTLYGVVVYSQIVSTNSLVNTFEKVADTLTAGINTLLSPSSTNTFFLKGINVVNLDTTNTCTIQYVLLESGTTTIVGYLSSEITINAQSTDSQNFPLYLSPDGDYDIGVNVSGSSTSRAFYLSYNTDDYS